MTDFDKCSTESRYKRNIYTIPKKTLPLYLAC